MFRADCSLLSHWVLWPALVPSHFCSQGHQHPVLCFLQIDYFNNQVIVDLVEQQHKGIIAILDDACMNVGKVTDEMFLEALNNKLGKHAHFSSRKVTHRPCCPLPSLLRVLRRNGMRKKGFRGGWVRIAATECEMRSPEQLQPQRSPAEGAPARPMAHPFYSGIKGA